MKMIKGACSALTVALMALTLTACPPPEEEPAAFDGQDTVPAQTTQPQGTGGQAGGAEGGAGGTGGAGGPGGS